MEIHRPKENNTSLFLSLVFAELLPFAALGREGETPMPQTPGFAPSQSLQLFCRSSLYLFLMVC